MLSKQKVARENLIQMKDVPATAAGLAEAESSGLANKGQVLYLDGLKLVALARKRQTLEAEKPKDAGALAGKELAMF